MHLLFGSHKLAENDFVHGLQHCGKHKHCKNLLASADACQTCSQLKIAVSMLPVFQRKGFKQREVDAIAMRMSTHWQCSRYALKCLAVLALKYTK
eukprot:5445005-Pleurochrysis_carterae.AAC.1